MRWASKKRQKQNRIAAVERVKFAAQFPECWFCGSNRDLCIDEMVSGMSLRSVGFQHREAWTRCCWTCNSGPMNGSIQAVLVEKLAMKFVFDRPFFDRQKVNVLRGRAPDAITMGELIPSICRRLDGGRHD